MLKTMIEYLSILWLSQNQRFSRKERRDKKTRCSGSIAIINLLGISLNLNSVPNANAIAPKAQCKKSRCDTKESFKKPTQCFHKMRPYRLPKRLNPIPPYPYSARSCQKKFSSSSLSLAFSNFPTELGTFDASMPWHGIQDFLEVVPS